MVSKPHGTILFCKCHTCISLIEIKKKIQTLIWGLVCAPALCTEGLQGIHARPTARQSVTEGQSFLDHF